VAQAQLNSTRSTALFVVIRRISLLSRVSSQRRPTKIHVYFLLQHNSST